MAAATRARFRIGERSHADEFDRTLQRLIAAAREFRTADGRCEDDEPQERSRASRCATRSAHWTLIAANSDARLVPRRASRRRPREKVPPGIAYVRYLVTDKRVRMIVATAAETTTRRRRWNCRSLNRMVFELREAVQDPDPMHSRAARRCIAC